MSLFAPLTYYNGVRQFLQGVQSDEEPAIFVEYVRSKPRTSSGHIVRAALLLLHHY